MSVTAPDRMKHLKDYLNNVFRTKLEIASDEFVPGSLAAIMAEDEVVRGNTTFFYCCGRLEEKVLARTAKPPVALTLAQFSLTIDCEIPRTLWNEMQEDAGFLAVLYEKINRSTDELVALCAKKLDEWDARAIAAGGDAQSVARADAGFNSDIEKLRGGYQQLAVNIVNEAFTEKAKAFGDYRRYQAKAAASLIIKTAGLVTSIAALATAATPAAPATLVPALLGIYATWAAIGKQVGELLQVAEHVEAEIVERLSTLQIRYKKPPRGAKLVSITLGEGVQGFLESVTGGTTALVIPSMKAIFGRVGDHSSKIDGLDVKLHEAGISCNQAIDASTAAETVFERAKTALGKKVTDKKLLKARTDLVKATETMVTLRGALMADLLAMEAKIRRVEHGRQKNRELEETLRKIDKLLGTKGDQLLGPGSIGSMLGAVAMIGTGYASPPTEHLETITSTLATIVNGIDPIRDLTPDVWEKLVED